MQTLIAGSCARPKSGGPVMVVFRIDERGAYCCWFNGRELEGATFDPADLEPASPQRLRHRAKHRLDSPEVSTRFLPDFKRRPAL
jgi:uncharacterized protein YodC (DUF2158 family)